MFYDFNDYFDYLCPGIVDTLKSYTGSLSGMDEGERRCLR
jgi:hypothetical protein